MGYTGTPGGLAKGGLRASETGPGEGEIDAVSAVLTEGVRVVAIRAFGALGCHRPGPGDHPAVEVDITVHDDGQGEFGVDPPTGGVAKLPGRLPILEQSQDGRRPGRGVGLVDEPAVPAVFDEVGVAGDPRGDAG